MGIWMQTFTRKPLLPLMILSTGAILSISLVNSAAASETRSYVVSLFTNAAYSQKGDCQGGVDPAHGEQYTEDLVELGIPRNKAVKMVETYNDGGRAGFATLLMIINRGRVNGKPVDAYTNPASVVDPKLHLIIGRYAYGFNLDGRGASSPNSFEDPVTHEMGVNDQLFRVLGCGNNFRGPPATPASPTFYTIEWDTLRPSFPAWLITLTGDDLSKDGPVTVAINRSLDHVLLNAQGNTESNTTFRIDPDPRSHNVFQGQIKNGVVTLTDHHAFHLMGDPVLVSKLDLTNTHLRLTLEPNGDADGIIGGYQPWMEIFGPIGHGGLNFEENQGVDIPGLYWGLRHLADADPDPKTGQNQAISVAWHIKAVPAFVVPAQTTAHQAISAAWRIEAQPPLAVPAQNTAPTPAVQLSVANNLQRAAALRSP